MSFPVIRSRRMSRPQRRRSWHFSRKQSLTRHFRTASQAHRKDKTKRKDIDKDYRTVRENGYATCWDEMEVGLGAIAVPIHLRNIGVYLQFRYRWTNRSTDAKAGDGNRRVAARCDRADDPGAACIEPTDGSRRHRKIRGDWRCGQPIRQRGAYNSTQIPNGCSACGVAAPPGQNAVAKALGPATSRDVSRDSPGIPISSGNPILSQQPTEACRSGTSSS